MPTSEYINDPTDIKLNTHDEVDRILGRPPGWILRYGILMIFLFFAIMAALSFLIQYPDKIPARLQILTEHPAIEVVAQSNGKLQNLFVQNGESVEQGRLLAILETTASLQDVNRLSQILLSLENPKNMPNITFPKKLQLGVLQAGYAALKQKVEDFRYFNKREDLLQKIQSLEKQILLKQKLKENLQKQKNTLLQEIAVSENNLSRQQALHKDQIVATTEIEKIQSRLLQLQRQLENLDNQIIHNDISIEELQGSILDLRQNKTDGGIYRQLDIRKDIEKIQSDIAQWKQKYLLKAPIAGLVSLSGVWSEQQYLVENQPVMTIVPPQGKGKVIAKAFLPVSNSGKVAVGQNVNIRLDGFPYQEFGIIKAKVQHISLVPITSQNNTQSHYLLDIQLPDTLRTTYDKIIPFRQEMTGTANIITEERRILERIFDRIFSA
ncbi:MAG TPA: HlyD family efflux transporter periplasmic adaptor subunit, partial [Phaeodactylibacter sp.]|nr:HlyD family efflux transporter periplasmic adaptor subunit [Phaeodactylibacter sp.]